MVINKLKEISNKFGYVYEEFDDLYCVFDKKGRAIIKVNKEEDLYFVSYCSTLLRTDNQACAVKMLEHIQETLEWNQRETIKNAWLMI